MATERSEKYNTNDSKTGAIGDRANLRYNSAIVQTNKQILLESKTSSSHNYSYHGNRVMLMFDWWLSIIDGLYLVPCRGNAWINTAVNESTLEITWKMNKIGARLVTMKEAALRFDYYGDYTRFVPPKCQIRVQTWVGLAPNLTLYNKTLELVETINT